MPPAATVDPRTRTVASVVTAAALVGALVPAVARADDGATPTTDPATTTAPIEATPPATTVAPPPEPTTTAPVTATTAPAPTAEETTTTTSTTTEPVPTESTAAGTTTETTTTTTVAPADQQVVRPAQIEYVLATIRYLESRGDYTAPPNRGRASGAYQYIPTTWAGYGGYAEAYLAPPWVQDERAQADVESILRTYGNDVSMVPVIWYYPAAARDPSLMDVVPSPHAGNVLTIREYQRRWLDTFAFISGSPLPPRAYPLPPGLELLSGIPPVVPVAEPGGLSVAFPLLGPSALAPPAPCEQEPCDEAAPAIVFGRTLQPVLAVADGVITAVELSDPVTGEVRVTVTDVQGRSYHYAGLNDDTPGTDDGAAPPWLRVTALAQVGTTVHAGQVIGWLGNSDATPLADGTGAWPHLRLSVTDLDGTPLDAEAAVVAAMFRQSCTTGIGPWSVPPQPADVVDPSLGADLVVPADDAGGAWTITPTGQVLAVGDAALVHPTSGCQWRPDVPFGPGGGGNVAVPDGYGDEIDLAVDVWLAAADSDAGDRPLGPMRRP